MKKMGWIYRLRNGTPDEVKIGFTSQRDPRKRWQDLNTGSSIKLTPDGPAFRGTEAFEHQIHRMFDHLRIWKDGKRTEWFHLAPELEEFWRKQISKPGELLPLFNYTKTEDQPKQESVEITVSGGLDVMKRFWTMADAWLANQRSFYESVLSIDRAAIEFLTEQLEFAKNYQNTFEHLLDRIGLGYLKNDLEWEDGKDTSKSSRLIYKKVEELDDPVTNELLALVLQQTTRLENELGIPVHYLH